MDVLYLKINDILEYNLPYVQSDFTCNPILCAIRFYVQSGSNSFYASGSQRPSGPRQ